MKKFFLIVVLLLSFELSKESDSLKNNIIGIAKCFLNTKENRDTLTTIFELLYTFKMDRLVSYVAKLVLLINDCTGKNISSLISDFYKFFSEPKIPEVLNKIKNFNAPILLRKYLHDYISKNGLENAKNECLSLIREKPFARYNEICSIL